MRITKNNDWKPGDQRVFWVVVALVIYIAFTALYPRDRTIIEETIMAPTVPENKDPYDSVGL